LVVPGMPVEPRMPGGAVVRALVARAPSAVAADVLVRVVRWPAGARAGSRRAR